MTDLFGNAIEEPGKLVPAKAALKPHSVALQPISHQPPPNYPIRPIASVIREGKPRETQTTTIWNQPLCSQ